MIWFRNSLIVLIGWFYGLTDIYIMKTDANGQIEWEKQISRIAMGLESGFIYICGMVQANDGSLVIVGGEAESAGSDEWGIRLTKTASVSTPIIPDTSSNKSSSSFVSLYLLLPVIITVLNRNYRRKLKI